MASPGHPRSARGRSAGGRRPGRGQRARPLHGAGAGAARAERGGAVAVRARRAVAVSHHRARGRGIVEFPRRVHLVRARWLLRTEPGPCRWRDHRRGAPARVRGRLAAAGAAAQRAPPGRAQVADPRVAAFDARERGAGHRAPVGCPHRRRAAARWHHGAGSGMGRRPRRDHGGGRPDSPGGGRRVGGRVRTRRRADTGRVRDAGDRPPAPRRGGRDVGPCRRVDRASRAIRDGAGVRPVCRAARPGRAVRAAAGGAGHDAGRNARGSGGGRGPRRRARRAPRCADGAGRCDGGRGGESGAAIRGPRVEQHRAPLRLRRVLPGLRFRTRQLLPGRSRDVGRARGPAHRVLPGAALHQARRG